MLALRTSTLYRIEGVRQTITTLRGCDFPYDGPYEALQRLDDFFAAHQQSVEEIKDDNLDSAKEVCSSALQAILIHLPILGFILRSTNVRNAFEFHGPLSRLAKKALGPEAKLIISSEWEFSPLTYVLLRSWPLTGFILVGFPAPESGRAFSFALSGHEFGHALWQYNKLEDKYLVECLRRIAGRMLERLESFSSYGLTREIIEEIQVTGKRPESYPPNHIWQASLTQRWATRQCQELFCDFVGLAMFREAYLYSFAYLLAPGVGAKRPNHYPAEKLRIESLIAAANELGLAVPSTFNGVFSLEESTERMGEEQLLLDLSDSAASELVRDLIAEALHTVSEIGIAEFNQDRIDLILKSFRSLVPAEDPGSIADILIAGWRALLQGDDFWSNSESSKRVSGRSHHVVSELMLKSIDVLEYRVRLSQSYEG